jgi:hypothetical protein
MNSLQPPPLTPLQAQKRRIQVLDRMKKCRNNYWWAEHTQLQTELENLNIILFGTPAPAHY